MLQKLSKCYPPILELIPIFLLVLVIYMAVNNYPILPDMIPTHFDSQGVPDGWEGKNWVFFYAGLSTFTYLLLTVLNVLFATVKNPMSLINIPKQWKDSLEAPQIEELRVILNRYLFMLKILNNSISLSCAYF